MKHKILLYLLMVLLVVATVNAEMVFKTNEPIDLKVPCFNNNTFCSSSATCNITILNPDHSNMLNNQVMTNQGNYFNYTLSRDLNNGTGQDYTSVITCKDGDYSGFSTFNFDVNAFGENLSFSQFFTIVLLIITWCLFLIGYNIQDLNIIMISGFFFMALGVEIWINGFNGFMIGRLTQSIGIIHTLLGFYFIVTVAKEIYNKF